MVSQRKCASVLERTKIYGSRSYPLDIDGSEILAQMYLSDHCHMCIWKEV